MNFLFGNGLILRGELLVSGRVVSPQASMVLEAMVGNPIFWDISHVVPGLTPKEFMSISVFLWGTMLWASQFLGFPYDRMTRPMTTALFKCHKKLWIYQTWGSHSFFQSWVTGLKIYFHHELKRKNPHDLSCCNFLWVPCFWCDDFFVDLLHFELQKRIVLDPFLCFFLVSSALNNCSLHRVFLPGSLWRPLDHGMKFRTRRKSTRDVGILPGLSLLYHGF